MVNAVLRGWEAQRFTVLEQLLNSRSQGETRFAQALDAITGMSQPSYVVSGSSGHARDFAYFTRPAMIRTYERYFVPNNATLVLVGDCTLTDVQRLADTYFGRIPRGPEPPAQMDIETDPSPGGTARLDWMEPLRPRVVVRHRIPAVGHPDRPVFDLIAALLRGRNGMLAATLTASRDHEASECLGAEASASRTGFPGSLNMTAFGCRDDDCRPSSASCSTSFRTFNMARLTRRLWRAGASGCAWNGRSFDWRVRCCRFNWACSR